MKKNQKNDIKKATETRYLNFFLRQKLGNAYF